MPEEKLWRDSTDSCMLQLRATCVIYNSWTRTYHLAPTVSRGQKVQSWISNTGSAMVPDQIKDEGGIPGFRFGELGRHPRYSLRKRR